MTYDPYYNKSESKKLNSRLYMIKARGWKVCKEDREVVPSVCRGCGKCRDHCTCKKYDLFYVCAACGYVQKHCECQMFVPVAKGRGA